MKKFVKFEIPFAGLTPGTHFYQYEIDRNFFEKFEESFLKEGNIVVKMELLKQPKVCTLDFEIKGTLKVECDRCLEFFDQAIDTQEQLLLKFSEDPREEDEIIYLPLGAESFNVAQVIYEFVSLALPIRNVHHEDDKGIPGCNPETLKYLNGNEKDDDDDNDNPLWDALQKFNEI